MNKIKILVKENKTLLREASMISPEELRMWMDQSVPAPAVYLDPVNGQVVLKDKRGLIRIDADGNIANLTYGSDVQEMLDKDFIDPNANYTKDKYIEGMDLESQRQWRDFDQGRQKHVNEVLGRFSGPADRRTFKEWWRNFVRNMKKDLKIKWINFKRVFSDRLTATGKARKRRQVAKQRRLQGTEPLTTGGHPFGSTMTEKRSAKIIEDLDAQIKAIGAEINDYELKHNKRAAKLGKINLKPHSDKKQKRIVFYKNREIKELQLFRDLVENNLGSDGTIEIGFAEMRKRAVTIRGSRANKIKVRLSRMLGKLAVIGAGAALYAIYELIRDVMRVGASTEDVLKIMTGSIGETLEGWIPFNDSVYSMAWINNKLVELTERYQLAHYRAHPPIAQVHLARKYKLKLPEATPEDKQIIRRAGVAFNYGVFVGLLKRVTGGLGGSAFDDPYKPSKKQFKPGAIPRGPKDPGYWSAGRGTGKMEESKNFQRSNKIKIKINS